ncbi:MAG: hypothetical protein IPJ40_13540 [Saprospirales bacterium]|nr:hypothetical protein [Saprospirales bacterium]
MRLVLSPDARSSPSAVRRRARLIFRAKIIGVLEGVPPQQDQNGNGKD